MGIIRNRLNSIFWIPAQWLLFLRWEREILALTRPKIVIQDFWGTTTCTWRGRLLYYQKYHNTKTIALLYRRINIVSISHEQKQLSWTIKKTVRFPLSRPIATSGRIGAVMREGWSKQLIHCCAFSDQLFNNFAAPLGLFSVLCCQCCVGCRHGCVCVCVRADFGCDLLLRYVVDSFNLNKGLEVIVNHLLILLT